MSGKCKEEIQKVEEILSKSCEAKVNTLKSCDEKEPDCPCSSASTANSGEVDLVVLVDSSGSMGGSWSAIADATGSSLLEAIKDKCGVEARITLLSLDKVDPGSSASSPTGFISHEQYILTNTSYTGPFLTNDGLPLLDSEQGSKGIADVSNHFPWREGACRSVLYVSDEWLDSVSGGEAPSLASIPIAVNAANSNNVTVFAHLVNSIVESAHYIELTESTGGSAQIGGAPSTELYQNLISEAICNCGKGCTDVEFPEIKPCVSISWGDSDCDSLETDDFEILCISVCNCYSKITFNNFVISMIEITDSDGNAPVNLPDGTPSVQTVPIGPICFGNIPPCIEGEVSCVNREFVINTRGAKDGEYQIKLHGICFDVNVEYHQESCFSFKLCNS